MIGRCLGFFYDSINTLVRIKTVFRDFSDVPHANPKESLMGEPIIEKQKQISHYDSAKKKKKDKLYENTRSNNCYMW